MKEWEQFFDGYASRYMGEPFVTATVAEVDFIEQVVSPAPGARILDLGCGTGRHSVELARRGYAVTGVDLSAGMLAEARAAAQRAAVHVDLVKADATSYRPAQPFDLALCLCEGSLGLLASGDDPTTHDARILLTIRSALLPGAPFLLTVLNGLRMIRQHDAAAIAAGSFDPLTLCERSDAPWDDVDVEQSVSVREHGFTPPELVLLGRQAGLQVEHLWGGTAGDWGRRQLDPDEMEIMVLGRRPGGASADQRRSQIGLQIRPVRPDDARTLSTILNDIIREGRHSVLDRTFSPSEERAFIEGFPAEGVFLVAERDGEGVVGFQALEPFLSSSCAFRHVATMGTWVKASQRGLGIGRQLTERSLPRAVANGFTKVFTDVRADNEASLAFHAALGFREVGRAVDQARYGGMSVDIVYIELDLRG